MSLFDQHQFIEKQRFEEREHEHGRTSSAAYIDIVCSCGWKTSIFDGYGADPKDQKLAKMKHQIEVTMESI